MYILHVYVYSTCICIFYMYMYILHIYVYSTYLYILHVYVYSTSICIFYMYMYILHIYVHSTCTCIFYIHMYILHVYVFSTYICIFYMMHLHFSYFCMFSTLFLYEVFCQMQYKNVKKNFMEHIVCNFLYILFCFYFWTVTV